MALAAEDVAAGALAAGRGAAGGAGRAFRALPKAGSEPITQTFTRLLVAGALGLIALEIISLWTGRFWSFDLAGGGRRLAQAGQYVGLYPGQPAPTAAPVQTTVGQAFPFGPADRAGGSAPAAMPGTFGGAPSPPAPVSSGGPALLRP